VEWVPPRKPETISERNKDADPLRGSPAVIINAPLPGVSPVSQAPVVKSEPTPPPQPEVKPPSPKVEDVPPEPPSPVNDPQYEDLMARLRRLKLDQTPKPPSDNA
jgi:hypothetical protein